MAVATHDHVDQRQGGSDFHVLIVADMAEEDDLVDPRRVQGLGCAADILDDIGEFDIVAG
ncbi:hypothetical protein D3C71_2108860 [compost metagenome]